MRVKTCPDCPEGARPRPIAGPAGRCATCWRAERHRRRLRAKELRVSKVYGLTASEYNTLLAQQGGRCAVCQVATGKARRLAVDHDHATGLVRGLLCKSCNFILLGRWPREALIRAVAYLDETPASLLGIVRVVPDAE